MGNERLTVLIGWREALPVRAIPYVAGWQRFSPDVVANYLAHNFKQIWFDSNTALTAYRLSGDAPIAIRPRDWDEYVAKLAGFEDELNQQYPTDNIGYAAWRNGAVAKLRAGTFVWLDEFEEKDQAGRESELWCVKKSDHAGEIYDKATYDKLTDEVLDLSSMLPDANTRAMVMEGFEDAVQDASIKTTALGQMENVPDKSPSGDTSGNLEVFRTMKNLTADELSIAFVGDKPELGTGINHMLEISARGQTRRVALAQLGLVNRQRGGLNGEGAMLLGMAQGHKPLGTPANAKTISQLQNIFKEYLGVASDLFDPKVTKWAPRFTITDKRGAADERAKQDALKYKTDSYEQLNEFGEKAGRAAEDSYSTEPLHESSDIDDLATKLLEEN